MRYVGWTILVIVCFFLGRVLYAPLAPALLADRGSGPAADTDEKEVIVAGPGGRMTVVVTLSGIKDEEIPEKVTLKKRVKVEAEGQESMYLEAGSKVLVKGREGNNLIIAAMAGPLEGMTKMTSTDLVEQVAKGRVMQIAGGTPAPQNPPQPEPAPPKPEPQPQPAPEPPAVAQNDPPMENQPEPAPEPQPEPEPAPDAPTPGAPLSPEQVVSAMQESVKSGQIKEFKYEQVEAWKASEDEEVDGESYQVGLAAYKAETIFGVKTVQAKALIQGGKVVKWVYAKTGMEIR